MRASAQSCAAVTGGKALVGRVDPYMHTVHIVHTYFQNIPMGWKSDPLDRDGGPSPKATPPKAPLGSVTIPLHTRFTQRTTRNVP